MKRPDLRSLPTPPSPAEAAQAESELTALFHGLLARGERDEESPDYDLLEAAVDGQLEPFEAELFASRLAGDAALEREFVELSGLRERLRHQRQTSPAVRSWISARPAGRRWLGLAAAAVLLAALGLEFRHSVRESESQIVDNASRSVQPLFADSFERGTTDRWSN